MKRDTGEYQDTEVANLHLRARQYDPTTGRFTAVDPVTPPQTDQAVSAYAYVNNMPGVHTDPTGLYAQAPTTLPKLPPLPPGVQIPGFVPPEWTTPPSSTAPGSSTWRNVGRASARAGLAAGVAWIGWEIGDDLRDPIADIISGDERQTAAQQEAAADAALERYAQRNVAKARQSQDECDCPSPSATMLGAGGTQTTSKTVLDRGRFRIDVENPAPGKRPGQLHLQDDSGGKYLYDFTDCRFVGAPRALEKILAKDPKVARAIEKGSEYLGL